MPAKPFRRDAINSVFKMFKHTCHLRHKLKNKKMLFFTNFLKKKTFLLLTKFFRRWIIVKHVIEYKAANFDVKFEVKG